MTISLTVTGARSQGSGTTNGTGSYTLSVSGLRGQSAYTLTTAAYTQPAVSATVTVSVQSSSWLAVGALVRTPGGDYEATALPTSTSVTLQNLGYPGAVSPGATVASGSSVTATGARGADGADGASGSTAAWSAATAYTAGMLATLSGVSYVCISAHDNQTPPNATYWTAQIAEGDSRLSDTRTPTDGTVTTAKIVDAAVTSAKLADGSVTSAKLPTVGPGAGTTGGVGSCVQSVTLDAQGRVTAATAASLPTSLPPSGSAGGDLTGTYPNPTLAGAGAGAGTYGGSSSAITTIILDAKGRPTTVTAASIAGDVSGSIGALSVDKIKGSTLPTAPASGDAGRILVVSGANAWRYGRYREYETTFSLIGNSGATNGPTALFTLPARFKLAEAFASLTTAITGTGGTSTFRMGSTSGGQEILLDWALIVGTTAVGTLWGDQPATERGTDMLAGRGFGAYYSASQSVYARSVASGANITAGVVTILLCGWEIP